MARLIKETLQRLPARLGAASVAILLGIGEGIISGTSAILEGPGTGLGKHLSRLSKRKKLGDYYDEFRHLRSSNARVIIHRLQRKGLVEKKKDKYELTSLGLKYYRILGERESVKQWDGKWRIVMFDIPEKMRKERQWVRSELIGSGYISLQKSVLIGKWPLQEDFFQQVLEKKLKDCVRIVTIGEIDDDEILGEFE